MSQRLFFGKRRKESYRLVSVPSILGSHSFIHSSICSYLGSRRIDRALDEAAGIFKQTDPYSSKILVLLTSGRQAQESDVTPFDVAIQPLRDMGTDTYVIAIGSEPSTRELRPLVSKAEDLFRVLFDVMQSEVPRIIEHIRKGIYVPK